MNNSTRKKDKIVEVIRKEIAAQHAKLIKTIKEDITFLCYVKKYNIEKDIEQLKQNLYMQNKKIKEELEEIKQNQLDTTDLKITSDEKKHLLDTSDVALTYNVSKRTVYSWIQKGWITPIKVNKKNFFKKEEIDNIFNDNQRI